MGGDGAGGDICRRRLPRLGRIDGAHLGQCFNNTVSKLRASDGALLGTFAVGDGPSGILFDGGGNIWVVNQHDDTVTKLQASDGTVEGTFPAGAGPVELCFDGANIWISDYFNSDGNKVTKLRASDGGLVGVFNCGPSPAAIIFDGTDIWVANRTDELVTKMRTSDGTILGRSSVGNLVVSRLRRNQHLADKRWR